MTHENNAPQRHFTSLQQASAALRTRETPARVNPEDELLFPPNAPVVTRYVNDHYGSTALHLSCGDKEVSFTEPDLFAFGEVLATQSHFVVSSATTWGGGYDWLRVQSLLEQLVDIGILQPTAPGDADADRPSPLPPATATRPRSWFECQDITAELTGRTLELGYLELVIPFFRIAHIAVDADGRQIGEGNVFPPALRLDIDTHWRTCRYPGSRNQAQRPMNISALQCMRSHWTQMMAALLRIRECYLNRFRSARRGWTIGHLQRLSTLVLAVPTYALMRRFGRVDNGMLHPALSSLFRVADGLRSLTHQMLFVPGEEPMLSPQSPIHSARVITYAERNHAFHSAHGVCAGPQSMVREFLGVLIDGIPAAGSTDVVFDREVHSALVALEAAFDYAMYGLQSFATIATLRPVTGNAYVELLAVVEGWATRNSSNRLLALRERLRTRVEGYAATPGVADDAQRAMAEHAYADMYNKCAGGLRVADRSASLSSLIAPRPAAEHGTLASTLESLLRQQLCRPDAGSDSDLQCMRNVLLNHILQGQAILRVGCQTQERVNHLLGRTPPVSAFTAADIDIYNRLQDGNADGLPCLIQDLNDVLGLRIGITPDRIRIDRDELDLAN